MIRNTNPGYDNKMKTWFSEPEHVFELDEKEIKGTLRSTECKWVGVFSNNMCQSCASIPQLPSFRKRSINRSRHEKHDISSIRNEYLDPEEMADKLKTQQTKIDKLQSKLFFHNSKLTKMQIR